MSSTGLGELDRRRYGVFETPVWVFREYIAPRIRDYLYDFVWVDMFCGSGNLILPMLEMVPAGERDDFFRKHIFMYDIIPEMVEKSVENAVRYGVSRETASKNIRVRDSLKDYPTEIFRLGKPVFHITNPPYMYLGYIKKNRWLHFWLEYFEGDNEGYQDLYQLALANDLRHGVEKMIYVIPTNFLYGASVSNKIREDLLKHYFIREAIVFERKLFEFTGQHVGVFFFERKSEPGHETQRFRLVKIGSKSIVRDVVIEPKNRYRAGTGFEEFVERYKSSKPVRVEFYLYVDEIYRNPGEYRVVAVDSNKYNGREYEKRVFYVNRELYEKIRNNILFVKTLDGVSESERAGLYVVREVYNADCIVVSRAPYRTHPIQLFFKPQLAIEDQLLLKEYFNLVLEYLRETTDSEFMTTYKYADTTFTRKYLGLTQVRKLIETFPILELDREEKKRLREAIEKRDIERLIKHLENLRNQRQKHSQKQNHQRSREDPLD
ncbi:MAG: N-6 DNA methylase, partial [Sulfolobales archaeon]